MLLALQAARQHTGEPELQRRLAANALRALAVSADGFAEGEDFAEAVAVLGGGNPSTITRRVAASIVIVDAEFAALAAAGSERRAALEALRVETRQVIELGHQAFADPDATNVIAAAPIRYLAFYLAYGVFPHRPLAHGMARASLAAAAASCRGDRRSPELASRVTTQADALLDKADELAAEARASTRLDDLLSNVHEALPLYAAAKRLLGWSVELVNRSGATPDPDTEIERRVTEEFRAGCIECVTSAFGWLITQIVSLGFADALGERLRDVAGAAVRQGCDRLPFVPARLRSRWTRLADGIPAAVTVPYGQRSADLAGRLAQALSDAFDDAFDDRVLVRQSRGYREAVCLSLRDGGGRLTDWDADEVAATPEECAAALERGTEWLEDGRPRRAARALAAARQSDNAACRSAASELLKAAEARAATSGSATET